MRIEITEEIIRESINQSHNRPWCLVNPVALAISKAAGQMATVTEEKWMLFLGPIRDLPREIQDYMLVETFYPTSFEL